MPAVTPASGLDATIPFHDGPPGGPKAPANSPGSPGDIRFTAKGNSLYAICLAWPDHEVLVRALGRKGTANETIVAVRMLGSKEAITGRQTDDGLALSAPREQPGRYAFVYRIDFQEN